MENFAVSAEVAKAAQRKRQRFDDAFIGKAVSLARQLGSTAAAMQLNRDKTLPEPVPVNTIDKWLSRWRSEGEFWNKQRAKRGRPSVVSSVPEVHKEWERQVDGLRAQGESVTGRVAAVVARAVLDAKAPSLLARHGGAAIISQSTGQRLLAAAGKSYRKGTSSRVVPPVEDLENARDQFYKDVRDAFPNELPTLDMILNFDQTFHLYNPNRGFTWEKRGADRVPLRQSKEGFTLLPVISVMGIVGAQMIFGGLTEAVFPRVDPGPLLHFCHTESHWSNTQTTVALWQKVILPYVRARRAAAGNDDAPVLVLADAFSPHWCPEVKAIVEGENNIHYVCVPESLTHYFQPLDLGVIAAMKKSILRRKDDFLEKEVATALREGRAVVLSKSRPVLREKVTLWIKDLLVDPNICAERCCRTGFERSGVLRALYGADVAPNADVDSVIAPPTCDDCGELGQRYWELPGCEHFQNSDSAVLCGGCMANHNSLCERL